MAITPILLKGDVYLTENQYQTLKTNGSIVIDGQTIQYDNTGATRYITDQPEIVMDSEMSDTSTNPVRNNVIKKYVDDEVAKKQNKLLNSTFSSSQNGTSSKEDTWKTTDPDTTLSMQHQNDNGQSGYSVSKNYTEMSSTLTTNGKITSTKLAITNDTATLKSEDGSGNSKQLKLTPTEMEFSERPKVKTNGETTEEVAIKSDLQNYVPTQSETTNDLKVYSQITNENGSVSIRVFENGNADLQNLSITKDGVTINGKKPLISVQPLFKHELVIPYSFSVTDPANGTATVNGSVMYHYLSNTETQITSASAIDDNFMISGGIGKNSANTILLFDVNVTKAGSSITVEAVSASTMGYITGNIGAITDTVTQLI